MPIVLSPPSVCAVNTMVARYASGSRAAIVEGAVAALTFAPDAFALTLVLMFALMLVLTFAPFVHAPAATAIAEMTDRKRTARMSVFFIVAFSKPFALSRDVINRGLKGKGHRIP